MSRVLVFLVLLLGGCGVGEALDRMDHATDQRACNGFGFRPGTDAYANCMMQQAVLREEEVQRQMDRSQFERATSRRRDKR